MEEILMDFSEIKIPVYIINLKERTDRLKSVLETFHGKEEFELNIIPAIKKKRGAEGLWQTIISIVKQVEKSEDEIIIICEDDHVFTKDYDRDLFISELIDAGRQGCQILLGGIGNYRSAVPISQHRLWIDWSWCTQFMVLYKPAFSKILNAKFGEKDVADEFLSLLLSNKMVLYPFVSVQKEFGYSDVTESNNEVGHMDNLFKKTEERLNLLMNKFNQYCTTNNR